MRKPKRQVRYNYSKRIIMLFLVFMLSLGLGYSLLSSSLSLLGSIGVSKYTEPIIMTFTSSSKYAFKSDTYREKITQIILENDVSIPNDATDSWDIGATNDGKVMAYVIPTQSDSSKYVLHIQGKGRLFANPNSSYLFADLTNVVTIDNLNLLDTSKVTNMSRMFYNCSKLTSLDLSNFNTSNVTDMSFMFDQADSLTVLDLLSFDTSNVTNMRYMFCGTVKSQQSSYASYTSGIMPGSLTEIRMNFNTSNVTNMSYMFAHQTHLTTINTSTFNTGNVTDMSYMFYGDSALTSIDVSSFNTSNVTTMEGMFAGHEKCSDDGRAATCWYDGSITSLNLSNFNTSNVTNMKYMFAYQPALTNLNLSSFDTSNVTDMQFMFESSASLVTLDLSSFNTQSLKYTGMMFGAPTVGYYLLYMSVTLNYNGVQKNSMDLTNIYISNTWNMDNVISSADMFRACENLPNYNSNTVDKTNAHYNQGGYLKLKQ